MTTMQFNESFNKNVLYHILQNKEKFKVRITDEDYDPFGTANKLLTKSINGAVKVNYHQANGRNFGRFFADNSISLQSLCREIRHSIAFEYYDDVDMVNAHPVILRHLCKIHNIEHEKLNDYIENRDKHISDLIADNKIEREDAKRAFLCLINGGAGGYAALPAPTKFIKRFKTETTDILEELCALYPKEFEYRKKSNPENPMGSTVNAIMCEWENKILQCILKFFSDNRIISDNCVLCFDGVMIPKHEKTASLLQQCEAYIFEKTAINTTLKIKPMDEGFDIPTATEYVEYTAFDPNDNFCWLEFDEKYRGRVFSSQSEIIERTVVDLNRVLCKVEQGAGFIVKKTDCKDNLMDILDAKASFTDMFFKYMEEEKQKEMSFKRYLQVFSNDINRYRSIDFAPNCKDSRLFNLWSGFIAHEVKTVDVSPIQLILSHIKEVYCNNDDVSYDYFLDLLYYIIKYPERPLEVATFIYSKSQGSGKNIILNFLQDFVFGSNITYYTTGLESILCAHNHLLKNKKIVIVDELASSSDNFVGNFDKFKSMMTGPTISINPKGVNQYNIKNVLSWFLISNHDDCIRVEATDRRYFCLSVSEKYIGNKQYFKQLADTFTQENGDIFYSYLLQRGDTRDVNIRIPPMNEFKKSIISKGWSSSIRFLFYAKDVERGITSSELTATEFYNEYKQWAFDNHEKLKSSAKFFVDISGSISKTHTKTGARYDVKTIVLN
jgi:putative DNA primase/helicase